MNSNLLKMVVPQLLKQADNPALKAKIIKLINDKKQYTLDNFIDSEDLEDDENLDCVLIVSTTNNELIFRVMIQDKMTGEMVGNCGIYRYEDIITAIKKAVK